MIWLIGLLLLETVFEGLYCSGLSRDQVRLRKILGVALGSILLAGLLARSLSAWQVWVWTVPFGLYRLINILRVYRNRLPERQLRTVALRAYGWLVTGQILVVLGSWAVSYYQLHYVALNVLVCTQLFGAIIVLRASTHTWSHSYAPEDITPLSNAELPTVSVLVPARNETTDLEKCLQALVASNYPKLEILVLDDCSANKRTPEVIRSFAHSGVRFLQGTVSDESRWLAKNYAYEQLAREASGEILLFCGVDAVMGLGSVKRLVELLIYRKKDMLSVLPMRERGLVRGSSLLQAMRYYWELCLPRRLFKRPPVLSTVWLIRRRSLEQMGGFEAVSRSISPEASFARRAVVNDAYGFVRSDDSLAVYSNKPAAEQYDTSIRVRYPQLHRRLELVALASLFELLILFGPVVGLICSPLLMHATAYVAIWSVTLFCLLVSYGLVAVGARLSNPWIGWLLMPAAFLVDIAVLHISMWKYEFSNVYWKGRNVCIPIMQVRPMADSNSVEKS